MLDRRGAARAVADLARTARRRLVVPVNVDVLVRFIESNPASDFAAACRGADLVLADGMPIVLASRLLGVPLPARVTGVDLLDDLAADSAQSGLRLFFFGAGPGVAEQAARVLARRHPGFTSAGCWSPALGFDRDPDATEREIARINAVQPDVLLVGLGAPRQEAWLWKHRERLDVGVGIAVGGSFDMIAGRVRRAPRVVRGAGLEWAWRLSHEPRRLWRRYLVENTRFFRYLVREWQSRRAQA